MVVLALALVLVLVLVLVVRVVRVVGMNAVTFALKSMALNTMCRGLTWVGLIIIIAGGMWKLQMVI